MAFVFSVHMPEDDEGLVDPGSPLGGGSLATGTTSAAFKGPCIVRIAPDAQSRVIMRQASAGLDAAFSKTVLPANVTTAFRLGKGTWYLQWKAYAADVDATYTVAPTISGTARQGSKLTGVSGTYANGYVTKREWVRGSTVVATGAEYYPTAEDVGAALTYRETVSGSGADAVGTSAATVAVAAQADRPVLALSVNKVTAAGQAVGTELATISNVPAGSTPQVVVPQPFEGSVVVEGSEGAGWKLKVAKVLAAASAFAFSVSAAGAVETRFEVVRSFSVEPVGGASAQPAFRGSGIHTAPPTGYSGAAAWSRQVRFQTRFPVPVRRIRAVLPTFVQGNTNAPDGRLAAAINFQVGLEYPFTEASAGILPRRMFTKDGSKTMLYDPSGGGPWPAIISDTLDLGVTEMIPANTPVGVWCVQERVDRTSTASWGPNGVFVGSGVFSVYEVGRNQTTSSIDENWCENATSVTVVTTPTQVYTPLFLVEMADGTVSVFIFGSSSAFGTGEGNNGSLISNGADQNYGDTRGDAQGRSGWIARLLGSTTSFVNCSIGSDRLAYRVTPANNVDRIALCNIMNPTHILIQDFINDVSDSSPAATIESNIISLTNQVRTALGRDVPLVLSTVTPNSLDSFSITSLTAVGTAVTGTMADTSKIAGAQTITISGASPAAYNGTFAVTIVDGTTFTYTAASAPGSSPATGTITAKTLWATVAGQTATANRGPGTIQDTLNVRIRSRAILSNKVLDVARYSQNSLTDTGIIRADSNRPNADTADGVHLNSCGCFIVSGEMYAAGLATTPFLP